MGAGQQPSQVPGATYPPYQEQHEQAHYPAVPGAASPAYTDATPAQTYPAGPAASPVVVAPTYYPQQQPAPFYPYPQQPQQQQQQPGYFQPALSPPSACGPTLGAAPAVVVVHGTPLAGRQQPCSCCSAGWALFGLGFMFPICWILGICLPCFTKDPKDRRAAIGSTIALASYVLLLVLFLVILPLSLGWYQYDAHHHDSWNY